MQCHDNSNQFSSEDWTCFPNIIRFLHFKCRNNKRGTRLCIIKYWQISIWVYELDSHCGGDILRKRLRDGDFRVPCVRVCVCMCASVRTCLRACVCIVLCATRTHFSGDCKWRKRWKSMASWISLALRMKSWSWPSTIPPPLKAVQNA